MHTCFFRHIACTIALLFPLSALAVDMAAGTAAEIVALHDLAPLAPHRTAARLATILAQLPKSAVSLRVEALIELSNCNFWLDNKPAALRIGKEVEKLGRRSGDNAAVAKGLLVQAYSLSQSYDEKAASRLVHQASDLAAKTGDVPLQVQALISLGESNADNGEHAKGLGQIAAALALAQRSGDDGLMFMALKSRAAQRVATSDTTTFEDSDALIALAKNDANPARQARAFLASYTVAARAGNAARALDDLMQAIPLLEALNADEAAAAAFVNLSDLSLKLRHFPAALATSLRAVQLAQVIGDRNAARSAAFNYGVALIYNGKLEAGRRQVESTLTAIGKGARPQDLTQYASALAFAGDADSALKYYRAADDVDYVGFRSNKQMSLQALQKALEYEKKQNEVVVLKNDNLEKATEITRQKQRRSSLYASIAFFIVLLATSLVFILRARRKNRQLATQQTQLMEANAALKWQSEHDWLTGLFNRRYFHTCMAGASAGIGGTFFLIDIDHFKKINDTFGHGGGDCVLKEVTRRLQAACGEQDMLARWGGEEFLIWLPGAGNREADQFAARILACIADTPIATGAAAADVTISVGYCHAPVSVDGKDMGWEAAANIADAALYWSKQTGRHRASGLAGPVILDRAALALLQTQFGAAIARHAVDARIIAGAPLSYSFKDKYVRKLRA